MTISFNLGSSPWWATFNLTGLSNGGGKIFSFSSVNPSVPKPIFQDAAGTNAYPNPILIPLNGQMTPMYFQFDTGNPKDNYFLILTDAEGNTIEEINNYSATGTSGGGSVTTNVNLNNLVINNVFWRNIGTISNATTPALANGTVLSPSSHSAFVFPDATFVLTGTCTQSFSFPASSSVVTPPALTGDVAPEVILRYQGQPGGTDSVKQIKIPISPHIATLAGQQMAFSMWAQTDVGATINVQFLQYAGTGGAPVDATTSIIAPTALSGTWTRLINTAFTVPAFNPANLGSNGNDGNYIVINLPLQTLCQVNLTKPSIYIGNNFPTSEFFNYDQIDSVINTPRTGDLKITLGPATNIAPFGWVVMNDGTIGNPASNATQRANNDTYYLYTMLWNQTSANPTFAPIFTSAGASTIRGGSADADFAANKRLQLLYSAGALIGNVGTLSVASGNPWTSTSSTAWAIGQGAGGEKELLTHNHSLGAGGGQFILTNQNAGGIALGGNANTMGGIQNTNNATSGAGNLTIPPTIRMNYFMKL